MRPNQQFLQMPKPFWACVRSLSQQIGYTVRGQNRFMVPNAFEMAAAFRELDLNPELLISGGRPTELANNLAAYFRFRADVLEQHVEPRLMNMYRAKEVFEQLQNQLRPSCHIPMNKQKGDKKAPSYLTGIVNMMVEAYSSGLPCDFDPRKLTTITVNGAPIRTLARRVDGAFPSSVNPVAVWEIKEYYYTTTFGSRVADGVYETLLDGLELEELRDHVGVDVRHYLMVDAYSTWWEDGKSYLCRMVDMVHMGYVDEVLFGYEVVEEMPRIMSELVAIHNARLYSSSPAFT